ncbi:MAG: TIGR03546 family protein [Synoicihabitans sp.]
MIITRKIGSILRGKATPFQLASGCVLGALLGFTPGFAAAPGWTLLLVFSLILLNANLFLAAVVGAIGKIVSWALIGVSFSIGQLLLDGPLGGLLTPVVNAPVLALFGFENYATMGAVVLGSIWGGIAAWGVIRAVTTFRRRMVDARTNSERYKDWNSRPWVRWSVFLLAGGGLKDPDYAKLLEKKVGNPVRPLGIIFVAVSVTFLVVAYKFFAPTIITTALRDGLEKANGATVELASADLDLGSGRLIVNDLAMADPNDLDANLFAAEIIEADISGADLLRKRLKIDNLVIKGAALSQPRKIRGDRTDTAPEPEGKSPLQIPDVGTLEDYIKNARVWKERLAQARGWLDKIAGGEDQEGSAEQDEQAWKDRLERIAQERGYASVNAEHLITESPRLLISRIFADNVTAPWLPDETLQINAQNLSTHPRLVPAPAQIEITSTGGSLGLSIRAGTTTRINAHYRGIPADAVGEALQKEGAKPPLQGGTLDVAFQGTYSAIDGTVDWPLQVTLNDTSVNLSGREFSLNNFDIPVALTGSLGSPAIKVDANQMKEIAQRAGTQILKDKAGDVLGEKAGGLLKGLFGGETKPPEDAN